MTALEARFDQTDARLAAVETKLDGVAATLAAIAASTEKAAQTAVAAEARHEARTKEREQRRVERRASSLSDTLRDPFSDGGETPRAGREIPGAAEGIQCEETSDGTKCTMTRALLDAIVADPGMLARQARLVPSMRAGRVEGFKVYGIRPGSVPKLLNLASGDIVLAINGENLGSISDLMNAYKELRDKSVVNFDIVRRGKPITLQVTITE